MTLIYAKVPLFNTQEAVSRIVFPVGGVKCLYVYVCMYDGCFLNVCYSGLIACYTLRVSYFIKSAYFLVLT